MAGALLAAALGWGLATAADAQTVVDDFETAQGPHQSPPTTGDSSSAAGAVILGGERDLRVVRLGATGTVTAEVASGSLLLDAIGAGVSGEVFVAWDGIDGSASLDPTGLGGADLTAGPADAFRVTVEAATAGSVLSVEVFTDGTRSSQRSVVLPALASTTEVLLDFSSFLPRLGAGADFTDVGAVSLLVRAANGSVEVSALDTVSAPASLAASKTDSLAVDVDSDTQADPGDTLEYAVTVSNSGGEAQGAAFTDTIDSATTLVPGSLDVTPIARDDVYTSVTTPITVAAPGVLGNDFDGGDGEAVTVTAFDANGSAGGTVSVASDGGFTYTPPAGGLGSPDTFSYTMEDASGNADNALVTVSVVDTAPSVVATTPADGATNVPGNATIVVDFSESVEATTASFTIDCGGAVGFTLSSSPASSFTLTPTTALPGGSVCTVTVLAAQISDADTNDPPDNMAADHVFDFTTDAAPAVDTTSPADGATQVATDVTITVDFTEAVNVTASAFTLECPPATPIAVTVTPAPPGGVASFSLDPTASLPEDTLCRVTVVAAEVSDVDADDPPDNMAADYVFEFTTDAAPEVDSTVPADGATGVARGTDITINFDESVNATATAFEVECPAGTPIAFTPTPPLPGTATSFVLNPGADLPVGTVCTVTVVGSQITDADSGDPPDVMAADYVFTFGVPPEAVNDTYPDTAVGNVRLNSGARVPTYSVTANDTLGGVTTIASFDANSAQGGNVTLVTSGPNLGQFTYDPPAGYEGADSFTYTVGDAQTGTATATVTVNVSGMIWFVNNGAPACVTSAAGCGRLTSPYSSLPAFAAENNGAGNNPAAGDNAFLYANGAPYSGPVTLLNAQRFVGQGATTSLSALTGLTPPSGSDALPATNSNPGSVTLTSPGTGVTVGQNNLIRGLNLGNTTGAAITGLNFLALTLADAFINTSNRALSLNNGAVSATFSSVNSTGGVNNVSLTSVTGSLALGGGTWSGASGPSLSITGGSPTLTFSGTIDKTNGQPGVLTSNVAGGSLTLGTITVSGAGAGNDAITLDGTGAAVDLTVGSVTLNTSSMRHGVSLGDLGAGSDVTLSAGSITSTGAGRRVVNFTGATSGTYGFGSVTLSASGSQGLSFGATQAGTYTFRDLDCGTPDGGVCVTVSASSGAITFRSVAQSGGTRGISLTSATGSFTVSGDGGGTNNGSGGTIQNTSAEGILLSGAANVGLGYMNVTNSGTDSVRITNVNGFTLNRSNISDSAGTAPADKAIDVGDFVTGTAVNGSISITNSVIGPAAGSSPHDSLAVGIGSGTSTWTVSNTTFRNTGNSGINLELRGTAVVNAFSVSNCTFAGAGFATSARAVFANNLDDSVLTLLTVQGSTFTNNNIHTDFNQQNDTDPIGSSEFAMLNNTTITGARSHAMNVFAAAGAFGGTFEGTVSGNAVGNAGVADSGSAIGNGIRVNINGGSDASMLLDGNTVRQAPNGRGVEIIGRNGTGGLDVTVTDNDVNPQAVSFPLAAILVQSNCLPTCNTVRSDVRGNTVPAATDVTDLLNTYIEVVESSSSTKELVDSTAPISGTCASELAGTNTGSTGVLGGCALIAGPITTP